MIDYQPYSSYHPSNIEWLGDLPAHWEKRRLKFVAPPVTDKILKKPENKLYIGLENVESGTGRLLLDTPLENVESAVTVFQTGDVLFGKLRPYLAKVVLAGFDGVCTSELLALRPMPKFVNGKFLFYVLLSHGFINIIDSMTYGAKMPRANPSQIGNTTISLPPLSEQHAVAAFLDRETLRIDSLISKKSELLEVLDEKRTSIISYAVTKGLNPKARMKASGIVWLGEVPEHWDVNLAKRFFKIDLGKMLDTNKQKDEIGEIKPYLRAANIFWEGVWIEDVKEMKFSKSQLKRYRLEAGDLLVTEGGVTVGRSAIWHGELEECYYQNSINRARSKGNLPVEFLYYWLYFLKTNGYIDIAAEKATFGHLTKEKLEVIPTVCPHVDEANEIIRYLTDEIKYISEISSQIEESITLLKRQRTALISAAVTGKIDVREQGK